MLIIRLQVGPLASNAYLLRDEEGEEGAVIDPGAEGDRIVQRCRKEGIMPRYLINTHGHVDHIGANAVLKAAFPDALLCVGARDAGRLTDPVGNLTALFGGTADGPEPDALLGDGRELRFGSVRLKVIETPGHTPGGVCLLAPDEEPPQLFCGDLVFRRGVGRSDLPGGDPQELAASIRRRVFTLPSETTIWPGHGERTTVGEERIENPFVGSPAQLHP